MLTPQLSVIIPTYNRKEILLKTLKSYIEQTAQAEILEILVIDDRSTDGTAAAVEEFSASSPVAIRCLINPNKGLSFARNLGIREAKGDLILFGDDDIIPAPTLVAEHTEWNRRYPDDNCAVLGQVDWSPEVKATPFLAWLGRDGVLFGFGRLSPGEEVSLQYCYFCNTSVKREFLLREGMFDENIRAYGYEDIELGYRLIRKGFRLFYNPKAVGFHLKRFSYAAACRRQESLCAAMVLFEKTEAGRSLRDQAFRAKPPSFKRSLMLATAKAITPFLVPLTALFDTHVRLPRRVYSLIYFFHVAPKAQAKFERSRERQLAAKAG